MMVKVMVMKQVLGLAGQRSFPPLLIILMGCCNINEVDAEM